MTSRTTSIESVDEVHILLMQLVLVQDFEILDALPLFLLNNFRAQSAALAKSVTGLTNLFIYFFVAGRAIFKLILIDHF